jgi:hypothetical protein
MERYTIAGCAQSGIGGGGGSHAPAPHLVVGE